MRCAFFFIFFWHDLLIWRFLLIINGIDVEPCRWVLTSFDAMAEFLKRLEPTLIGFSVDVQLCSNLLLLFLHDIKALLEDLFCRGVICDENLRKVWIIFLPFGLIIDDGHVCLGNRRSTVWLLRSDVLLGKGASGELGCGDCPFVADIGKVSE